MTTYLQVNPESLISIRNHTPLHGRGAWTKAGIEFDYRYMRNPNSGPLLGSEAEKSLAHWAVSAGIGAIQKILIDAGYLGGQTSSWGVFGLPEKDAVFEFQVDHVDPQTGADLVTDGIVGRSDSRALLLPLVRKYQDKHSIPDDFILGQTAWESALDVGAVGYYIFYGEALEYRGVDRGLVQSNSRGEVTWRQAFNPNFALNYSAKRMRTAFDGFKSRYPQRDVDVLWDAAIASHNSPLWGGQWAQAGAAPNEQIAKYVNSVKNARF